MCGFDRLYEQTVKASHLGFLCYQIFGIVTLSKIMSNSVENSATLRRWDINSMVLPKFFQEIFPIEIS